MTVSLVKRPMPQGTLWVCVDCTFLAVNGDAPVDPDPTQPEPWASFGDQLDVTPGLIATEHDCDYAAGEWQECECETRSFSLSQCDGCGSYLGGSRHAFTYWS